MCASKDGQKLSQVLSVHRQEILSAEVLTNDLSACRVLAHQTVARTETLARIPHSRLIFHCDFFFFLNKEL